jgi:hypothetical protein
LEQSQELRVVAIAVKTGDVWNDVAGFGFVIVIPKEICAARVVDEFAAVITLKARAGISVRSSMKDKWHSRVFWFRVWWRFAAA